MSDKRLSIVIIMLSKDYGQPLLLQHPVVNHAIAWAGWQVHIIVHNKKLKCHVLSKILSGLDRNHACELGKVVFDLFFQFCEHAMSYLGQWSVIVNHMDGHST
jgi:hypothetical protein